MIESPYLLISDLHLHSWSAFSTVLPSGMNTRLKGIITAIRVAACAVATAGGNKIFIAGDVFHKRGSIEPAVLNPVLDLFRELVGDGFGVYAIPGNHDLSANNSQRLSNAVTALESVGVVVAHEPLVVDIDTNYKVVMFPWYSDVKELIGRMTDWRDDLVEEGAPSDTEPYLDAIIHAPIDGVLPHLPGHGFDANAFAATGFDRVFCGHYHHHRNMGDGVYSIGALTHQSWGDIDSQAGYMLVYRSNEEQHETDHPKFVELTGTETDAEAAIKCKGNYVRVRCEIEKDSELKEIREGVEKLGARGVIVLPQRKTVVTRAGIAPSTSVSIESSIKTYLDKRGASAAVHALALDILSEARVA